ncbi:MAG: Cation efflux system protein CusB precursor [Verrucomicrobiota bacterium]|jgi:Cu(I)/Ag(I) efflux system membrane fusion protein
MRSWFALGLLAGLLATAGSVAGAAGETATPAAKASAVYQCPMHPWIKSERPGKCTICGMDLVAARAGGEGIDTVSLPRSSITVVGVESAVIARQPLTRTVRVTGRIDDDDTRHRILSARVPGRIEKLHVNFVGAPVQAGAPLITLFSPEVLTAQRVFVERIRSGEGAFPAAERSASRERLIELGLSETDIAALEKSLQPTSTVVVRAPFTGTVVSKNAYEGQYVQASDRLLELADFSRMWFVFDAYAQDIPWLHVGQPVEITTRAVPGEVIVAPIEFIDPNFNEMTQTAKVRAVLPNPHYSANGESHSLPHRVLAEGRVLVESPAVLAAPRSAVLDPGTGPVAYVDRGGGNYERRALRLGRRGDALVEVLSGLHEGEKVVATGALLIDAQAQLSRETSGPHPGHTATPPPANAAPDHRKTGGQPTADAPEKFSALANAAVEAAAALASDDFARYRTSFPALLAAAKEFPALPKLELGDSIKSSRRSFEPWSTQVADLLKPHRTHLGLKIFQCPMTPVLGKGRWVQRNAPLKNPFFGAAMANCGEEIP